MATPDRWRQYLPLAFVWAFGLLFWASHVPLQFAGDDIAWLHGQLPTAFDRYRYLSRLSMVSLNILLRSNVAAILLVAWAVHSFNAWLLYQLGLRWLGGRLPAAIAFATFVINPLTLQTLTWISCFSYLQGTALALLALLAAWRAVGQGTGRRLAWAVVALGCFGVGLFCSHEILFLPALFLILGWQRGNAGFGAWLAVLGMALALAVNVSIYHFDDQGIDAGRLASLDFGLAYASSGLASGLSLGLAYPLSFFARPFDFLRLCFTEPVRWTLTAAALAVGVLGYDGGKTWRLRLALALSFLALITPYLLRLYLTPDTVHFHISYALSGRVFYTAFVALALVLGHLGAGLYHWLERAQRRAWPVLLLPLVAYGYALWLYDRHDFLGLVVAHPLDPPPRWTPYPGQHPAWLLLPVLAVALSLAIRCQRRKMAGNTRDDDVNRFSCC